MCITTLAQTTRCPLDPIIRHSDCLSSPLLCVQPGGSACTDCNLCCCLASFYKLYKNYTSEISLTQIGQWEIETEERQSREDWCLYTQTSGVPSAAGYNTRGRYMAFRIFV